MAGAQRTLAASTSATTRSGPLPASARSAASRAHWREWDGHRGARRADGRGLRLRVGEADCGICELSAWMELRPEVSRPAPGNEVFLHPSTAKGAGPRVRSRGAGEHRVPRAWTQRAWRTPNPASRFSPTTCEAHVN